VTGRRALALLAVFGGLFIPVDLLPRALQTRQGLIARIVTACCSDWLTSASPAVIRLPVSLIRFLNSGIQEFRNSGIQEGLNRIAPRRGPRTRSGWRS
jgi:hypothetical protein